VDFKPAAAAVCQRREKVGDPEVCECSQGIDGAEHVAGSAPLPDPRAPDVEQRGAEPARRGQRAAVRHGDRLHDPVLLGRGSPRR
jgi:hypothetical protein